jgi:hypothetical protein
MKKIDLKTSVLVLSLVIMTAIATTVIASADTSTDANGQATMGIGKMVGNFHRGMMDNDGDHGRGMMGRDGFKGKGNFDPEMKEKMDAVMESGDYNAWKVLVTEKNPNSQALGVITEANFSQLVEAHNLRQSGDFEGAKTLMESIGLENMRGERGQGGRNFDPEMKEKMDAVMESGDYNAWKELETEKNPNSQALDVVTEANFSQLVEAHNLKQSGDFDGAKTIFDELGLTRPMQKMSGRNALNS